MKANVGGPDKIIRVAAGVALIAFTLLGIIGAWGWIGIVAVLTGAVGYCPAYSLLEINTCPMKRA